LISGEQWDLASKTTKAFFIEKFRETILNWISEKETEILDVLDKKKYQVACKSFEASIKERNQLEAAINESREKNNGGVDLATLDRICRWGFNTRFPERNPDEVIKVTRKAFESADKDDFYDAAFEMMKPKGVNISRASKIIGLSNQERLCIYDSRVGHALRTLKKGGVKLIRCPPDRSFKRDWDSGTKKTRAIDYERLIWTTEVFREHFKNKNRLLGAADIEIALYVLGEK
jgi:hypothetical protein